jgi:hypothetical protein
MEAQTLTKTKTHVISPTGAVAERIDAGDVSQLRAERDAQAERLRAARDELDITGRAEGLNTEQLASADRTIRLLWSAAIASNIAILRFTQPHTQLQEILDKIVKAEAAKRLASRTASELTRQVVSCQITVLREEAALKSIAAKLIRAQSAERMRGHNLESLARAEGELQISSSRVDQEIEVAVHLESQALALDKRRKEVELLYEQLTSIEKGA